MYGSEYEFSGTLIAAQRAFWAADARVQEVTDALPSSVAVPAGEAEVTEEQRAELAGVREARLQALEALDRREWWANGGRPVRRPTGAAEGGQGLTGRAPPWWRGAFSPPGRSG
ncbi:hypothetical protein [Streptosporangium carneum]|uniref:Uncharacterized protein n=1 Tax=Streptosporangium carneum TaxID=47481 RepID=A0A9W6I8L5_9ACTN|nr:hypothetical protein [Streptosporangium carneum]GLK14101.1 hypothetical protein GCM10017600_75130 [Streptosporangium carneum]